MRNALLASPDSVGFRQRPVRGRERIAPAPRAEHGHRLPQNPRFHAGPRRDRLRAARDGHFSLGYSLPGFFKADVYVYNGGLKNLGTGIAAEAVRPHFKEVQDAIRIMEKRGSYKGVKRLEEKETT